MIFAERKTDTGYNYQVDEVFGTMSFDSTEKLDGEKLDALTMLLLQQSGGAKVLTGTVKHETGSVTYTFTKREQWSSNDDMMDLCNTNTPTKTPPQAKWYTAVHRYMRATYSWLPRFVGAFRKAWYESKNR